MTPELVEDEALRGDFMLRAFVLLLAALLACTEVAETATLVHIKTGQFLSANGWLPPGQDVFSFTVDGRPWYNLTWLFDLALAGMFSIGGAQLLTILKVVIVAATFFLVTRCVRPGVSTWWGSIAAALALLTCHPQFTALPEVVTLLGLAVVLWVLHRWQSAESNRQMLWWLVPTFVLWSNLDNRMFLGLALLLLYAVGDLVGSLVGASGLMQSERRRQLWTVLLVCFAAACINPFGWQSLLEPSRLYGVEYPAFRVHYANSSDVVNLQYLPLMEASVLKRPHVVAGLVLIVAALLTLVLNRRQFDLGHVFALFGFVGFAVLTSHEIAAAAIVACVVATLNGQEWYRDSFSQEYSIEVKERFFSSGGRAVTVLAMFAIAFLASSGRISDPASRRVGLGFHPELATTIEGLRSDLKESFDDRAFNFRADQGDLLIWLGQKPFIDSRLSLYAAPGHPNVLAMHDRARDALQLRQEGRPFSGRDEIWKEVFDKYEVNRALPRLSGARPDYGSFFSLRPPNWTMTELGSMTAAVHRTDNLKQKPKLQEYLKDHQLDLIDEAFKQEADELSPRPGWPQVASTYQFYLSSPRSLRPAAAQKAMHLDRYIQQFQDPRTGAIQVPLNLAAATAHSAIRHANEALIENPNSATAYEVLGNSYAFLNKLEGSISGGGNYDPARRYRQTVAAYNLAILLEPDRPAAHLGLFKVYSQNQKPDLALRALRSFDEFTDFELDESNLIQAQQSGLEEQLSALQRNVESRLQQIQVEYGKGVTDSYRISQVAYGQGCVLRSLELLEQDRGLIAERPDVQLFYALLLHEVGRIEEASDIMQSMEGIAEKVGLPPGWQKPAAWARLASADYAGAIKLWSQFEESLFSLQLKPAFLPLALYGPGIHWMPMQTHAIVNRMGGIQKEASQAQFDIALSQLEAGQVNEAADSLNKMAELDPTSGNRVVAEFYYFQLTGERFEIPQPLDHIPLDPSEMFTPDEESEKPKSE